MNWSPPYSVEELASIAYHLSKDGDANNIPDRWDRTGTALPYRATAQRLDNLRIMLAASVGFDTDVLTWTVIVPGDADDDPDEIVQSPSITTLCDALDALVTRRTGHVEEHTRQDPSRAASYLKAAMAPSSYLVLSHGTSDSLDQGAADGLRRVYEWATAPAAPRSAGRIARFLDGLEITEPGLCDVASWRAASWPPAGILFLGGVGKKL